MSTTVIFYEKPGCLTNSRQKALLHSLGHRLQVRNLLTEPWTAERLRAFFGERPVAQWLNPSAPRIKAGEVDPQGLDEARALALMLADPLLIRRPLLEVGPEAGRAQEQSEDWERCCGFEPGPLLERLGIEPTPRRDLELCSRPGSDTGCPPVEAA
jgi:nitrogenase-associated protein